MMGKWLSIAVALIAFEGGCSDQPAETPQKSTAERNTDDFGLPLVIVIDVPETPPEIRGPSPPIQEKPRKPAAAGGTH
jgi:hypothetical protein